MNANAMPDRPLGLCELPPIPMDEAERQKALDDLRLLDTPGEERFDRIVRLAQTVFHTPIAYIALVDRNRQWFKSKIGMTTDETTRDISFCGHTILQDGPLIVPDALQDYRFACNPTVVGEPFIRFYAGQPLRGPSGYRVGTICIADREPREIAAPERDLLAQLAWLVEREFTLIDKIQLIEETQRAKEALEEKGRELERTILDLTQQKQHNELLLQNIFPRRVADELRQQGRVKAVHHEQASVFFSDFTDFTTITSSYSAGELVDELNRSFCFFDGLCARHGVEKLKTIGDGYLAVAGLTGDPREAALKLAQFAVEAQAYVQKRKQEMEAGGRRYWSMRVGLHTGPIVAGVVGVRRMAYDIWGDTVNIAARMEQAGEPGRINISSEFRALLGDAIVVEARGACPVKSCGNREMFFLTDLAAAAVSPRPPQ